MRVKCRVFVLCALSLAAFLSIAPDADAKGKFTKVEFKADEADPLAKQALSKQRAFLDRRTDPLGRLVIFLHGAGVFKACGPSAHMRFLAEAGFHVFSPCYVSDYGVENCGDDIGSCRKEAFDGIDAHEFIDIPRADSIEERVAKGLLYLDNLNPSYGWGAYLDEGGLPRWDDIILSGHSHGASTAALIGKLRKVERIVMLAGPYDQGQAWYESGGKTGAERYYGLSHKADRQNKGHLAGFENLGLGGGIVDVDVSDPPYGGSQKLVTGVESAKPHSAVRAGNVSPKIDDVFALAPAWRYLYGREN